MTEIYGKGHELLSLFDIEYHQFSKTITDELLSNPEKKFKLVLEETTVSSKFRRS